MTVTLPSAPDVWAALGERIDPIRWRPRLAADIEVRRFDLNRGMSYAMIGNPRDLVYYRLTLEEADLLPLLDGEHTIGELAVERLNSSGELDVADLVDLVQMLEQGGFLTGRYVDVGAAVGLALHPPTRRVRTLTALRTLTVHWHSAEATVRFLYRWVVRWAFTRIGFVLGALVSLVGATAFIAVVADRHYELANRNLGVAFVVLLLLDLSVIFIHELGHASALVHYGRRVKGAGFRVYFGSPSFFIESSDGLMLPRGQRIIQSFAGPALESVATGIAAIVLWFFPGGAAAQTLYQFVIINYFALFLNLIPMLELDGYWMLSDALQLPDLRPDSLAFVRHELWHKLRRREHFTRGELGLAIYGSLGALVTVAAFGSSWFFWRRVFGNTIARMWHAGWDGRLLLLILIVIIAGPAIRAVRDGLRAVVRSGQAQVDRLRFRFEQGWRIEAAELLDAGGAFGDVPVEALNDLAGRVRLRPIGRGETVFRQGDPATAYYLVRRGSLEVVAEDRTGVAPPRRLRLLGRGEGFGEMGLVGHAPRNATVRALERSEIYELDKGTFDRVLAERAILPTIEPTAQQGDELRELPQFSHLGADDVAELLRLGEWMTVAPGEELMRQGDTGDCFYVIGSGRFDIVQDGAVVDTRGPGDHVGELALLLDAPRSATVRASSPARVYRLGRSGFHAMVAAEFRQGRVLVNAGVERVWDH
jgi:putative peptide zinc metalloprotease protein